MSDRDRRAAIVMVVLMAVLGLLPALRPVAGPPALPRVPAAHAQPWMADCLPGVGAKTRDRAAAAIRVGDLDRLPPQARARARELFSF